MERRDNNSSTRPAPSKAGAKIPDKPRDCGPHVDTWPILDSGPVDDKIARSKLQPPDDNSD